MRFVLLFSFVFFVSGLFSAAFGREIAVFRHCTDCTVAELDRFFNETDTPYESFKLIHSEGTKGAAVLFHGLGDSPYYMKDIAELYYRNGYDVYTPLLKAHGESVKQLESVSYLEWNQQAEALIQELSDRYQNKVQVAGFSNGGLISTVIALKASVQDRIESLLLLSPAFGLPTSARIKFKVFRAAEVLNQLLDLPILQSNFKKLLAIKVRTNLCAGCNGNVRYDSLPLNGPAQLLKNTAHLNISDATERISIPMIMVLTSDDKTISLSTALTKFNSLFSGNKKLIWLQGNAIDSAPTPQNIPPEQIKVIRTDELVSHVLTLKAQGLARIEEVNFNFREMSDQLGTLFMRKNKTCSSFYR